jgi:radical SAM protein with 4Fe4S-binding SPASM domain
VLIGGEAYLRKDWLDIVKAIRAHGMDCSVQTGGRGLTEERIRLAAEAGIVSVGVSIDGLQERHDHLRGVVGSYSQAIAVLGHLKKFNIPSSVNTQITAGLMPDLRELMRRIADAGAKNWQVQLTVAMGAAADRPELLLQPYELLELMPLLAAVREEALEFDLLMQPGNNIGYFGPFEHKWRIVDDSKGHWQGCVAGQTSIGIEADGTIKGCPSLPTQSYAGGNVRDMSVEQIWTLSGALRFTRERTVSDLWGYCKTCYYADVCRAGCTWTTHVLFGRPGNNPYCHYRALEFAKRGLRERIVKVKDAPGEPFDHGYFQLVTEPVDGLGSGVPGPEPPPLRSPADALIQIEGRIPPTLELCRGCDQFVMQNTLTCPHCGGDIEALRKEYERDLGQAWAATENLRRVLAENGFPESSS